jgi:8-oxo-dGTP diphosphatase
VTDDRDARGDSDRDADADQAPMTFAAGGLLWRRAGDADRDADGGRTGAGERGDRVAVTGAGERGDRVAVTGAGEMADRVAVTGADERGDAGGTDAADAADPTRRLAVVHRPRYDDWSLPKGKLEPGELLAETAVREVREETGFAVRRGPFAGRYQYRVESGPKSVFVWHMTAVAAAGSPDAEVDELAWLPPAAALDRLTYPLERDLVERSITDDSS